MNHPDLTDTWLGLVEGTLSRDQSTSIQRHLDGCSACREDLASLVEAHRISLLAAGRSVVAPEVEGQAYGSACFDPAIPVPTERRVALAEAGLLDGDAADEVVPPEVEGKVLSGLAALPLGTAKSAGKARHLWTVAVLAFLALGALGWYLLRGASRDN
jgi:anti-sigma factor RsiW